MTTIIKAALFSVVMIPDLNNWFLGFLGIVLGLLLVEWIRMFAEIFTWGMSQRSFQILRLSAFLLFSVLTWHLFQSFVQSDIWTEGEGRTLVTLWQASLQSLNELSHSELCQVLEVPFLLFPSIVSAYGFSNEILDSLVFVLALAAGMGGLVVFCYQVLMNRHFASARREFRKATSLQNTEDAITSPAMEKSNTNLCDQESNIRKVISFQGAGPIAWRQWLGIKRYASSVVVSMIFPGFAFLVAPGGA